MFQYFSYDYGITKLWGFDHLSFIFQVCNGYKARYNSVRGMWILSHNGMPVGEFSKL